MRERSVIVGIGLMLALALNGAATAQLNKYELNMKAWAGISFAELFALPGTDSGNSKAPALTLAGLVDRITANLKGQNPPEDILKRLEGLKSHLNASTVNGTALKDWRVCSLFEKDLEATGPDPVKTLFTNYFKPLENLGLAFPFLEVASKKTNHLYLNLAHNPRFLEVLGKLSYPDFFEIGMSPLVPPESLELTRQVLEAGMFGALLAYGVKNDATVDAAQLDKSIEAVLAPNGKCCDTSTQKCAARVGYTCVACGSYCCVISQTCP